MTDDRLRCSIATNVDAFTVVEVMLDTGERLSRFDVQAQAARDLSPCHVGDVRDLGDFVQVAGVIRPGSWLRDAFNATHEPACVRVWIRNDARETAYVRIRFYVEGP